MDGFWNSLSRWFDEKTSSPFYFTYVGFFIVWNWRLFQVLLFEDSSLFSQQPRIEYIAERLYIHTGWMGQWGLIGDCLLNLGWRILPPSILTYLAIVWFPYIQKWALEQHLKNWFERKRIFETKQRQYDKWVLEQEKERTETLKETLLEKKEQAQTEEKIKGAMSDEERWELEYRKFEQNTTSLFKFSQIIKTIYKSNGYLESNGVVHADAQAVAIADSRELIAIVSNGKIEWTKKGKVFARMYMETHPYL